VEVRRRTKVIGRFPGETSALPLIWAVLELSSRGFFEIVGSSPQALGACQPGDRDAVREVALPSARLQGSRRSPRTID